MNTLYLDCGMGAAGDMLTAALLELHPDPDGFIEKLNRLGIPNVTFVAEKCEKCGIAGTRMKVLVHGEEEGHHHPHHGLSDIAGLVSHLNIPEAVRQTVMDVYRLIADAESRVHGEPVEHVHFHEVGALDAVADVTAVCLLMQELAPEKIIASPVHVGSGQVRCAHGILPVPAPATALLLQGVPTYGGTIQGELCTPTGAALLKHFVSEFGPQPEMAVEKIGYGCGKKDFPQANCLCALLGQALETILELRCCLDDMTPEGIGFAMEVLLEAGALDVFTTPIGMKKNRPGTLLTCLCRESQQEDMLRLLFRHTTTLGVRQTACSRYALSRRTEQTDTPWGPVRMKISSGFGVRRQKPEYDDLARIAREQGISLAEAAGVTKPRRSE